LDDGSSVPEGSDSPNPSKLPRLCVKEAGSSYRRCDAGEEGGLLLLEYVSRYHTWQRLVEMPYEPKGAGTNSYPWLPHWSRRAPTTPAPPLSPPHPRPARARAGSSSSLPSTCASCTARPPDGRPGLRASRERRAPRPRTTTSWCRAKATEGDGPSTEEMRCRSPLCGVVCLPFGGEFGGLVASGEPYKFSFSLSRPVPPIGIVGAHHVTLGCARVPGSAPAGPGDRV